MREEIEKPWPTFFEDVRRAIDAVNISYRVNRRVTGRLHEDTLYSEPKHGKGQRRAKMWNTTTSQTSGDMTPGMIDAIVDDTVRMGVQDKVTQLGGFRKGMFTEEGNHPYLKASDGRIVPIHKARIR